MSIRVTCKNCRSKIDARDELLGQTRRCPKCQVPILIQPDPVPVSAVVVNDAPALGTVVEPNHLDQTVLLPAKLNYDYKYIILTQDRVLATWEVAQGWLLNVGAGFVPAKRNPASIPDQGTFAFVELVLTRTEQGLRLSGLNAYKISARAALMALTRTDDEICSKIDGPEPLNRSQKASLITYMRKHFMFEFLSRAEPVMDYLSNNDWSSTRIQCDL
ncbi:MAG: zinc-ribbon domain-containing protein [Planctomycetaceae bacterium]|nr:zinc-ribbon domain-containing protein [Planctomycetaceae bacterium]